MMRRYPENGTSGVSVSGPSLTAVPLWSDEQTTSLSAEDRVHLSLMSTIVRYSKGEIIHQEGKANAVFCIISGVAKSLKKMPNGACHVAGFLFHGDLLGMAESGRYTHSVIAITDVVLYRIPVTLLVASMKKNPMLDYQLFSKICHQLRDVQRHASLLSKKSATVQTAFFLQMQADQQVARGDGAEEIYLPMTRGDIASYIGISPEAVSRALKELTRLGAIAFRDRHHVLLTDAKILDHVAADLRLTQKTTSPEFDFHRAS